jgi:hypothetical protein
MGSIAGSELHQHAVVVQIRLPQHDLVDSLPNRPDHRIGTRRAQSQVALAFELLSLPWRDVSHCSFTLIILHFLAFCCRCHCDTSSFARPWSAQLLE